MTDFDLDRFLPYLLNQAAETASRRFQKLYREDYGLTRTEWRVIANLGKFGAMTARDICEVSQEEKTKVSRAVAALETEGRLMRAPSPTDGRAEILSLTGAGQALFAELGRRAQEFDQELRATLGRDAPALETALRALIGPQPSRDR